MPIIKSKSNVHSTTKKTILVFISRSLNLVISSLISLVLVRVILTYLGSDFNGLNAILTQVLTLFVLVENSFSFASRVALFGPYMNNDISLSNKILSATKKAFSKIGIYSFFSGLIFTLIYSFFLKTEIDLITIFLIFLMALFSVVYNTIFVSKYLVLFQVTQTEYYVNFINVVFTIITQIIAIIIIIYTRNILLLRFQYLLFNILMGLSVIYVAKRRFPCFSFQSEPDFSLIKGTKDVLISTTTGIIYKSAAVFFISSFGGTLLVSVYAVYSSVLSVMERFIFSIIEAPQNAFGQIISKGDQDKSYSFFKQYEHITILLVTVLLPVTYSLIFAFVRLYTQGVTDINYDNVYIGLLLVLNSSIQFAHIPSGNSINLSGHFQATKKIQITALFLLILTMILGSRFMNLFGILLANTLTGIFLLSVETYYARKFIFFKQIRDFYKVVFPNFVLGVIISFIGYTFSSLVQNWFIFIIIGFVMTISSFTLVYLTNFLLFPQDITQLKKRVVNLVSMKLNRSR